MNKLSTYSLQLAESQVYPNPRSTLIEVLKRVVERVGPCSLSPVEMIRAGRSTDHVFPERVPIADGNYRPLGVNRRLRIRPNAVSQANSDQIHICISKLWVRTFLRPTSFFFLLQKTSDVDLP